MSPAQQAASSQRLTQRLDPPAQTARVTHVGNLKGCIAGCQASDPLCLPQLLVYWVGQLQQQASILLQQLMCYGLHWHSATPCSRHKQLCQLHIGGRARV